MKRVLLTGATGFIGRHCVPELVARGYEVHTVSSSGGPHDGGYRHHQADLLNPNEVSALVAAVRPTHLLHCAWYAEPGKYWSAPENFRWVAASLHLWQTFAACGGQRALGVGTCAEYDSRYGYCSERVTPLNPTTTYGICKHALQLMLDALSRQNNFSAAWGRLFFLYGPGERRERLVPSVICSLLEEQPARCSHGQQLRDFLYVQDAAEALVALLDSNVVGTVNIASGVPVTLRQVIESIGETLARSDLIQLGVRLAPQDEPLVLLADVGCLRDEVNWQPRYDLAHGLAETIDWWRCRHQKR